MRRSLLVLSVLLCAWMGWGQKRVIDPVRSEYSSMVTFDRIEITPTQTIAEVTLRYRPRYWVRYSPTRDFLQDCNSDRRYKLMRAEGFELDKEVYMPDSGSMKARFIFEPIDPDVKCVDFLDGDSLADVTHYTYGISLVPAEEKTMLPAWAMGNWLTTDGSNEWLYGFTCGTAIYRKDFWNYAGTARKGKSVQVELQKGDLHETLYLREGKSGTLLVSRDNREFITLGRELVRQSGTATEWKYEPEKYRDILYHKNKAVVRGLLDGYTPKLGFQVGVMMASDQIWRKNYQHLVEIQPDGRFEVAFEIEHPQTLSVVMGEDVVMDLYVEPSDTLMCYYSMAELLHSTWGVKNNSRTRFMGNTAAYNLFTVVATPMMPHPREAYARMEECVKKNETQPYCAWVDERKGRVEDSLSVLFDRYAMSDRTRDLLYTNFTAQTFCALLEYEMSYASKKYTYTQREDGTWSAVLNSDWTPLPRSFYDRITMERVDNPLMIMTSSFSVIINRLEYTPVFNIGRVFNAFNDDYGLKSMDSIYVRIKAKIEQESPVLSSRERTTLDYLKVHGVDSTAFTQMDSVMVGRFGQYLGEYLRTNQEEIIEARNRYLYSRAFDTVQSYGLTRSLAFDYTLARFFSSTPYSSDSFCFATMVQMLPYVKTPYVIGKMVEWYTDRLPRQRVVSSDKPRTKADDIFDALVAPYKGNVLFLDFWETGCGPCRSGMISAKKIVAELKDRKIKFLYITSDARSPLEPYNKFLNDNQIQGEHLRVTTEQWHQLQTKFNIYGIPHYVVVDQNAEVVDNNGWCRGGPNICKEKLLQLLETVSKSQ